MKNTNKGSCQAGSLTVSKSNLQIGRKNSVRQFFGLAMAVIVFLTPHPNAFAQVTTFGYTGIAQPWTVPSGVSLITVTVNGAPGGSAPFGGSGGCGARVMCTLAVTPGQILNIFVGGAGGNATSSIPGARGFNGGGAGAVSPLSPASAGGGGASDIRIGGTTRPFQVITAGGGGGGGAHCGGASPSENGGDAGGASTAGAGYDCGALNTATCGQGASPGSAGLGATSGGFSGSSAGGGTGTSPSSAGAGGGGGGGYFGGGGGYLGGGGGGSSFVNSTLGSSITYATGTGGGNCSGDGSVALATVSCTPPVALPITGPSIVCPGNSITLNDATGGGTWLSTNSGIASVGSTGIVTGNSVGNVLIYYILSNSCGADTTSAWIMVGNPVITTIAGRGATLGDGGPATASQMAWPASMVADASNNILVTDFNAQRVRQITPGGIITTIIGTGVAGSIGDLGPATNARLNGPAGLFKDGSGNIYVTEQNGCRVRKVDPSGTITTIAGTGTCTSGGDGLAATAATLAGPTGVAVDGAGNVYISEWNGGKVRKVNTSGIISTIAGGGGTTGTGGPATAAILTSPYGIWLDGSNLYISEENAYRVRVVDLSTGIINAFAGTGSAGYTGDGGPATAATFNHLSTVFATDNNVYISDADNEVTRVVSKGTGIITTLAGNHVAGFGGDGGDPLMATCYKNSATAIDGNGYIYIAESGNHCIRKIAPATVATVTPIAGSSSLCQNVPVLFTNGTSGGVWTSSNTAIAAVASASGQVTGIAAGTAVITYTTPYHCGSYFAVFAVTVNSFSAGTISGPDNVCPGGSISLTDATPGGAWSSSDPSIATVTGGFVVGVSAGNVAISYTISNGCGATSATQEISVGIPTVTTIVGTGLATYGGDGGPATAAQVVAPVAAVVDASGNIYISDNSDQRIRMVNTSGIISTIAGTGLAGYNGDGVAATCKVNSPHQLAVDALGNIYFADEMNHRVRKINPLTGIISTVAGNGTLGFSGDGFAATAAQLNRPRGVAFDAAGNLYIGDMQNERIRKVSTTGVITTFAGTGTIGYNGDGLMATAALLASPAYLTFDRAGNLIISDLSNVRVRMINTLGIVSTIAGNQFTGNIGDGGPGTAAELNLAGGAALDAAGNIYLPDNGNNRIRVVTTSGIINAYAGSSAGTAGYVDGSPLSATKFRSPTDLVWDQNGNMIVVDNGSHVIRKIAPQPVTVASVSGAPNICAGVPTLFTDATPGGTWVSSNPSVATVGSTGLVLGVATGVADILYSVTFSCGQVVVGQTVTVSPLPAIPGPISGPNQVCQGTTISLSDGISGGTWVSGSSGIATVGATGIVSGISPGVALISYTIGNACASNTVTTTVTVTSSTGSLSGSTLVCEGSIVGIGAAPSGGTWTSGNTSIATIGSTSGIVGGVSAGSTTLTYTFNGNCIMTFPMSVNPLPPAISGTLLICSGNNSTLSSGTGGSWSSGNPAVATVGPSTGTVLGILAGSAGITYTSGAGCRASAFVTVNNSPAGITPSGPVSVCTGASVGLSDGTPGGTWSSGSAGIASVSSGGSVSGLAAGVATISYSNSFGCAVTKLVTVNQTPAGISPANPTVCTGSILTLSDIPGGGTWTSTNSGVAPVGSASGIVTGATVGTATISYTVANCSAATNITVNPSPAAGSISGPAIGCTGSTLTLIDGAGGGTWSSSNPGIASVGPATGIVTGVSVGSATITYAVTNSCGVARATYTVTINASPAAGTIIGVSMLCAGTYSVLVDAATGGVWSASNSHASITGTGLLTGISLGTDTITYRITNTCGTSSATKVVTIGPFLTAGTISGAGTVCTGSSITLTDPATGGIWTRSNASASVSIIGHVSGVFAGMDTISYTVTSGCGSAIATKVVTVIATPVPAVISGPASICAGAIISYTASATGGAWSVTNSHATITGAGVLTGMSAGTDTIKYTISNSCGTAVATKIITIGAAVSPGSISGPSSVCPGATITLTDGVAGGRWSSSSASATIGSTGIVTGVSAGTTTISYTIVASCGIISATKMVTVNPAPNAGAITGSAALCIGAPGTYTATGTGGIWTMSNSHATISSSGLVTPVSAGRDTVRYTVINSCGTAVATLPVTIGTAVSIASISGPATVCIGATITLADPSTGGTWSAGNTSASVGSTGIVTGIRTGVDTIRYTITGSCNTAVATAIVSVSPAPVAGTITGPAGICTGTAVTYTDAAPGGTWSLSNTHASVSSTGVVTPVSTGTDTLLYSVTGACGAVSATFVITIGTAATAGPIAGLTTVCTGTTIALTDGTPGGTWSSSNANASIGSTGIVTGNHPGIDTIRYTIAGSCGTSSVSTVITVNASPATAPIVGPSVICAGTFTIYTDAAPGGSWSVSNIHATIAGTGVLTAGSVGVDTVMYSVVNSCGSSVAAKVVTISSSITAGTISGPASICMGSPVTLSDGVSGGAWSSSNTTASISSGGLVTGLRSGTDTISYTVSGSCGTAVAAYIVTIGSSTGAGIISGPSSVCVGSLITLTESVGGGAWSSSNTNATITTAGVVTGIVPGSDTISYTITSACGITAATSVITVSPAPAAGTISGPARVCVGAVMTLTDPVPGGLWSTGNHNATVSGTGIVTGVSAGTVTISYTVFGACGSSVATWSLTIDPLAAVAGITGFDSVCIGSTIALADATPGGIWTSGNPNATVSITGIVTGMAAGTAPVSYTVAGSCGPVSAVMVVTILPSGSAAFITGPSSVCVGSGITLTASASGGSWLAANSSAMIVGPGIVDGMFVGIDTIYYRISGMCGSSAAMHIVSVNPLPVVPPVTGPVSQPSGTFVTLSDALPGGIWTSSNPAVASIAPGSGIVTGISSGSAIITYTVTNSFGCPGSVTALHMVGGIGMPVRQDKGDSVNKGRTASDQESTVHSNVDDKTTASSDVVAGTGELRVFPNPNSGTFSFTVISAVDGPVQLIITDVAGRVVAGIVSVTNKQTEVKLSEASGIYILKASDGVNSYLQKIIIQ